jgi:xylulokinase
MSYLLGIDVGTTGSKTLLIDECGEVVASAMVEYAMHTPHPLWAEQDPADWWQATVEGIQRVLAGVDAAEVKGLGLTGQMHGLVLLDGSGEVLRPCIMWNDQRTGPQCAAITERLGLDRIIAWTANPVLPGFTAPKIVWVRENEPQVYDRVARVLLPKDFIRYKLTGGFATDKAGASGTSLLDVVERTWSQEMAEELDIPADWLPVSYEGPEVTGTVTSQAAELTGLPVGLPVVAGGGDQEAQAVGTGIVHEGLVSATLGTSGVVFAHTDEPKVDSQGRLQSYCHAVPGKWHVMGVMLSAGGSFRWFRDTLGRLEKATAELTGHDPYEHLTAEAARVPAGSEGLIFLPYLTGERMPYSDPNARGSFFGLTIRHDKPHLVRSVLEGVAYGLRDLLELVRDFGLSIEQVRASGGGARSELWRQILADVFATELVTINVTEGAAYGAALLASVGAGIYPSVEEACEATIHIVTRTEPKPEHVKFYGAYYPVYRSLYAALKPAFDSVAQVVAGTV